MTSSTESLRRMLDERGVKWVEFIDHTATAWTDGTHGFVADEDDHGKLDLNMSMMTPEQAIAATLGRGTCHEVWLLTAMDVGNGCEEVLGVYSSKGAAEAAASEDSYGYAFHNVQMWEVDE